MAATAPATDDLNLYDYFVSAACILLDLPAGFIYLFRRAYHRPGVHDDDRAAAQHKLYHLIQHFYDDDKCSGDDCPGWRSNDPV